jgi:hypothetical protein
VHCPPPFARFRRSACAAAIASVVAAGCQPPITLGRPCVRPSDCAAPLVCQQGRCREECSDHRDCPAPARCVTGNDGLGACTLEGDLCDPDRPCGEDLECVDDACYDPCVGGACPAGGACVAGACERPTPAADAGTDAGDDGGATFPPRERCTSDVECGAGSVCTRVLSGTFTCRRACTAIADCGPATTAATCGYLDAVGGGTTLACTLPCDVFGGTRDCLDGETCDALELSGPTGVNGVGIDCRPVDPAMRTQGQPCDVPSDYDPTLCAPGFDCDGVAPGFTCQQLCAVGATIGPPCPAGTSCDPTGVRYLGVSLGTCAPG